MGALTRRAVLLSLTGLFLRKRAASASLNPAADGVRLMLSGLQRSTLTTRHYRVNVAVIALGIPLLRRSEVGGGFASVETGAGEGVEAIGLQFAAGSWPERSAGLNRFGMFREAYLAHRDGRRERAFAGFITSSKEETLGEARKALKSSVEGMTVAIAWGGERGESGWFHRTDVEVPLKRSWQDAAGVLSELLEEVGAGVPRSSAPGGAATFLTAVRNAALTGNREHREGFLHNGRRYDLHTRWHSYSARELDGQIRNAQGEMTAEFRTVYQPGDPSGLPVKIEYHARSYLRLTFESQDGAPAFLPTLFPSTPA